MSSTAKGTFPGKPRKKLQKKKLNFSPRSHRKDLEDLKVTCSFITNISHQFDLIFDDGLQEGEEFLGFNEEHEISEDRPVSQAKASHKGTKDKKASTASKKVSRPSSGSQDDLEASHSSSPKKDTEQSESSSDSAFLRYKNSKLDFHRLSRKARSKEVYKGYSAEEQAKRKDTSVASLKYASNIYLAKDHTAQGIKSPIKPATFIPPKGMSNLHVAKHGATSLVIKRGKSSNGLESQRATKPKASRSFVLPTKSARSSRIIKANRKYLNDDSSSTGIMDMSQSLGASPPAITSPQCSVQLPRLLPNQREMQLEKLKVRKKLDETCRRRPLIKEPTFQIGELPKGKGFPRRKDGGAHARVQRLLMRAKGKQSGVSQIEKKQLIKDATFTAPFSDGSIHEDVSSPHPERRREDSLPEDEELSDLGLSPAEWKNLRHDPARKDALPWTRQEVHNVLHGAHTFGAAWASITRQYDFHELRRDWSSVCHMGIKCRNVGLLSSTFKLKSSVLLQLKPKLSDNPNVTVFTPSELKKRGLAKNVTCDLTGTPTTDGRADDLVQRKSSKAPSAGNRNDVYLGLSSALFKSITDFSKPKWLAWEIHNIIHGVHWFGAGQWQKIFQTYRFRNGHTRISLRARFKAICSAGLADIDHVRADVLPKLRPMLTALGRKHFAKKKVEINHWTSKSKRNVHDVASKSSKSPNRPRGRPKTKIKEPTIAEDSDDSLTISPPRKQAYHLFGTAPVWDDASQPDLIGINCKNSSTPVMKALEDGLRRNSRASSATKRRSKSHETAPVTSSSVTIHMSPEPAKGKPPNKAGKGSAKKGQGEGATQAVPGKGPRIKHVCRRASLVTGQVKATYDDFSPQLSALPREEREKIAAQAEKQKDHTPCFSTSESDEESKPGHRNSVGNGGITHVPRKDKPTRKRHSVATPCGNCEACDVPPCGECDACRTSKDGEKTSTPTTSPVACLRRPPCKQPIFPHGQPKKARRSGHEQQGSRKSSRLRQQKMPLLSSSAPDPFAISRDSGSSAFGNISSNISKVAPSTDHMFRSPSSLGGARPDVFSPLKQAIVKLDNWKETYDLDKLWKTGGHALITSHPVPPRVVCFLCGSLGASGNRVKGPVVYCACCCEPFHAFCVDQKQEQTRLLAAMASNTWVCKRCRYCHVCGHTKDLLECRHCQKTYHSECLGSSYPTKPSDSGVWVCMRCVRCQSCGVSKPGNLAGAKWTHDFTMCQRCGDLYDKGNFCPICQRCYSDEDFDTRMVQCAGCKRWVHSKCESLTVEMYTLLAHLPDNIQYKCPDCDDRGARMQEILNEEDEKKLSMSPGEISQSTTPDAERVRKILARLPAPRWRTVIEEEIQSGLEEITMSLFHNHAMYCILKRGSNVDDSTPLSPTELDDDTKRPCDLFAVRFAVHNRRYRSLGAFYSDVHAILVSVAEVEDRISVMRAFKEEAGKVFPWFNFDTGRIRDTDDVPDDLLPHATMPPVPEHDYAQWLDKDITRTPGTPFTSPGKWQTQALEGVSPHKEAEDLRLCLFCSKYGDEKPTDGGRLLYCGQDEWCHVNCGLWSAEVFEQHDGSMQNVHSAASRGKMMKCDHCRLPGATVGCHTRDCPKNYHFMCARKSGCYFQVDRKVYCARHLQHVKAEVLTDEQFEVGRLVCVDNDEMRPNRRWHRGIPASNVTVTIGSLTVHHLGQLSLASDCRECLTPVSYRVTRLFWSAFSANKKAVYTITITDRRPSVDSSDLDKSSGNNMTISHVSEPERYHSSTKSAPKPVPCKSNLLDRIDDVPHIGPLSPTRRTPSKFKPPQPSGTYTIVSGLNQALPKQVTPVPAAPLRSDVSAPVTSQEALTPMTPGNPFLKPASAVAEVSTSQSCVSLKPILYNSSLGKLAQKFSTPNQPKAFTSSQDRVHDSHSVTKPPALTVPGTSGGVTTSKSDQDNAAPYTTEADSETNRLRENLPSPLRLSPVTSSPSTSELLKGDCVQPSSDKSTYDEARKQDAKLLLECVKEVSDSKELATQDAAKPAAFDNNADSTISLLSQARKATATEVSKPTQPGKPKKLEPDLWWKKQSQDKGNKSFSDGGGGPSPPSRRDKKKWRSTDDSDPSFILEAPTWVRQPGETSSEVADRTSRTCLERKCKMEPPPLEPLPCDEEARSPEQEKGMKEEGLKSASPDLEKKESQSEEKHSEEEVEETDPHLPEDPNDKEERSETNCEKDALSENIPESTEVINESHSPKNVETKPPDPQVAKNEAKKKKKASKVPSSRSPLVRIGVNPKRLRSKSHDLLSRTRSGKILAPESPSEEKPPLRHTRRSSAVGMATANPESQEKSEPAKIPQPVAEDESKLTSTPRRYPRRDSNTCLKSFSGLSPNYAIASYSRTSPPDSLRRKASRKKSSRRPATPKSSAGRQASKARRRVASDEGGNKPNLSSTENAKAQTAGADKEKKVSSSESPAPPHCPTSFSNKEEEEDHREQVEIILCSLLDSVCSPSSPLPSSDSASPKNLQDDPESPSLFLDPEVSFKEPGRPGDPKMEDKITSKDSLSDSEEIPKSSLDSSKLDASLDADESVEEARGGGGPEEETKITGINDLSALEQIPNTYLDSFNPDDSMGYVDPRKETKEGGTSPQEEGKITSSINLSTTDQLPDTSFDLTAPQSLVSQVMDLTDHLPSPVDDAILKNDLLSAQECPVLNADEVETLLESPETPYPPPQAQGAPFPAQNTVMMSRLPGDMLTQQTGGFYSINSNPVPDPKPQFIPNASYQTLNNPQTGQLNNIGPGFSLYNDPPAVKRTPITPSSIPTSAPLPYSMRVTMAMTGVTLASDAFHVAPDLTQKREPIVASQPLQSGQAYSNMPMVVTQQGISAPLQNVQQAPRPMVSGSGNKQMGALEQMIDFYSAKNNLTPEEKEIVRSIISSQIRSSQLPMPTNPVSIAGKSLDDAKVQQPKNHLQQTTEDSQRPKKRKSSREKDGGGGGREQRQAKMRRKRSGSLEKPELRHHHQQQQHQNVTIDAPWSVHPDDDSIDSSFLMEIYEKRKAIAQKPRLPALKTLSAYNIFLGDKKTNKENRLPPPPPNGTSPNQKNLPYLVYEIKSDDGYYATGPDLQELVNQLFGSVQECRSTAKGGNPCLALASVMTSQRFLGLSHDAVRFLVEQLPGARHCHRYRAKYHKHKKAKDEVTHINPHGCCRAEKYKGRSKPDMFSFLASKYRIPPDFVPERHQDDDMMQLSNRRATSMEQLPMAMRFRHLRTFAREAVGVYRSSIHGRGLFCKRDFDAGEMIMEYTGEMIRKVLTDKREKFYESKSIGCYMFRMDDYYVVDATLRGSSARFVNHSCEPNCYSRIVQAEGKKHIVIFALRRIYRGEELTYDYKFPIEDETHKITCNCGARSCRKFMN